MTARQDLRPLTGLRFFAALWVIVMRDWPVLGAAEPGWAARGGLGVELFFMLSGFVLGHVYLDALAARRFDYPAFLRARLVRIYPLHLATLAAVGVLGLAALASGRAIDANVLAWRALAANLLLVHAWGLAPVSGWNHPSWSVSAEWFAYLIFPALGAAVLAFARRPRAAALGAAALLAAAYAVFPRLAGFPLTEATIAFGALRILPPFLLGLSVNLFWKRTRRPGPGAAAAGALLTGAAALAMCEFRAPDSLVVTLFAPLIYFLASAEKPGKSSRAGQVLVYLGEISYATYMICVPLNFILIDALAPRIGLDPLHVPLWYWLGLVAAPVLVSILVHEGFDKPVRAWVRARRWRGAPSLPGVA